ncbi:unnamed protein product [Penicillium egyptiacum]|uniref:Glycoside hydrolase family 5 C-terminal domain-containing protein n=1 Tax=Penicillium egyptiacum TaxID=1303716 RepID=A0A9W4P554_9EURO|nr:unnamed protein product [Penicillium egyptiacum]
MYDEEWIDFTIEILRVAKEYGFYIFMDPHQDVWSRLSGGSGAPTWTLYAAGLNPKSFKDTQAAIVHNKWDNPAEFPKMLWCTNYTRLACQTMFTLFWAGRDFAPKAIIDGVNIQDYLQRHFIAACKYLAQRIQTAGDLEGDVVIGWESMNEPNKGLIGIQDISSIPSEQHLQLGTSPTAFQAMVIGSGLSCEVIDPKGEQAWLSTEYDDCQYGWHRDQGWRLGECLWAQHGVWDLSQSKATLLQKDYFSSNPITGETLDYEAFTNSYFLNHYRAYKDAIRSVCGSTIMFCQPPVMELPPSLKGTADDDPNMVHAAHFYDGLTLLTKHWLVAKPHLFAIHDIDPNRNRLYNLDIIGLLRGKYLGPPFAIKIGETLIRKSLRRQLKFLREESLEHMGDHPLIFTEIGIPYDMDDKRAYKAGDYSSQIGAMDANHFALEGSTANGFALWAYVAENDHQWGDQWNGEDLSIYSQDDLELPVRASSGSTESGSTVCSKDHLINIEEEKFGSLKALIRLCISLDFSQATMQPRRGYRAVEAWLRPAPVYMNRRLESYTFDLKECTFTVRLIANQAMPHAPSEIYLPEFHFPMG